MCDSLPGFADTVVIGGGTAGAAIAGELAARSDQSLLLLEAGPDYGSFAEGRWPVDLTDARAEISRSRQIDSSHRPTADSAALASTAAAAAAAYCRPAGLSSSSSSD